jgi:hypothetical protein
MILRRSWDRTLLDVKAFDRARNFMEKSHCSWRWLVTGGRLRLRDRIGADTEFAGRVTSVAT